MLKLFCLGTPRLVIDADATVITLTPKATALLFYLAVTPRAHSRDLLADLLWSETNNRQARANLRYLLPEIRQPLGDYLVITPQSIAFQRQAPYWLDVAQLHTALTARPETIATSELQAALALYQGEFLAGFTVRNAPVFEAWVVQQREELHTLAIQGGYALAERYWQQAAYQSGLAATQRLLQWEPWHEAGHRLQMQLLAASGQRTAALAHYERCRAILAAELGVAPEDATTALYAQLRNGEMPDQKTGRQEDKKSGDTGLTAVTPLPVFPSSPLPVSPAPPLLHNLPGQLTPFFGRENEIAQISALLRDERYRLVTLLGEGGIGKTRLALAVAQAVLDFGGSGVPFRTDAILDLPPEYTDNPKLVTASASLEGSKIQSLSLPVQAWKDLKFPDGVWFVALTELTTTGNLANQLAVAVAKAIGIAFDGSQPLFTQILAYLRTKSLLLIFDNAEQLLPEVADLVVQLLQSCPSTTILVTSRHLLGLQAEFVWRVTGLALPLDAQLLPTALQRYSSIALFVERASHAYPQFAVTEENKAAIVAICRLVEGLPLAIELAAPLTKQYTGAALYAALQHDSTLLTTTYRDLPPRHRSIKAILDHSWRLLTAPEAESLAACAIFPGSFDLAAATAITGAQPASMIRLIDQSLLYEVQETTGNRRYALHPLVRHYAAEQLQKQPAVAQRAQQQHCAYYLAFLVRQSEPLLRDPATLQIIQNELDNLRTAWAWAIDQAQFDQLQQSSKPLAQFYKMVGFYEEAEAAFRQAAARLTDLMAQTVALPPDQRRILASLQVEQAYFCARLAQGDKAEALAQAALQVGVIFSDGRLQAQSHLCLALSALLRRDYAAMQSAAAAAAAAAYSAALPDLAAWAIQTLGIAYFAIGDSAQGLDTLQQALTIAQTAADRHLEGLILGSLGSGYYLAGNFAKAHDYLQQAGQLSQAMKLPRLGIVALSWRSSLYLQVGRYDLAANDAQEAQKVARQIGRHPVEIDVCSLLALAHYHQGAFAAAEYHCQQAIQLSEAYNLRRDTALAHLVQGHLLCDQGQWQAAAVAYAQARQVYVNRPQPLWNLRAQAGLAQCWFSAGDLAQALAQVEELLPILADRGQSGGMNVYETILISYAILTATADPRADALLDRGYHLLQQQAAHFADETLRHTFLAQVAANRDLVARWSARHDPRTPSHHR